MNIYIASDHAGLELKTNLLLELKKNDSTNLFFDLGPVNSESIDYPDFADLVCEKIKMDSQSFGILICGSGQGMSLRANKFSHIRAALVYNNEIAQLSREHNNCNIICLGSRFCTLENAKNWIKIFIKTPFSEGRHRQRVEKIHQPT